MGNWGRDDGDLGNSVEALNLAEPAARGPRTGAAARGNVTSPRGPRAKKITKFVSDSRPAAGP